jgi:phosphoribosylformimino-5-aminoimidazole carboxamide ribotide isomerase
VDILPAIDIRGGKCVRLVQGDYARETIFADDPVAMARHWVDLGAHRLHIVDLDGAKERRPVNDRVIERIVSEVGASVQVAGGMRDVATIDRWAATGADRIVIGTLAVEDAGAVSRVVQAHGSGRIAVSVDARDGRVAVKGWTETSTRSVDEFLGEMAACGVTHFIYTDITRDGMMEHPDFAHVAPVAASVREVAGTGPGDETPLTYAGGITSVDDIIALAEQGLEGVISGRALYDGSIDLREALRALAVGDDW